MTSPMNTVSTPPSTKWVVRLRSNSHKTNTFRTAPVRTTYQMIAGMLVPADWMRRRRRSTNSPTLPQRFAMQDVFAALTVGSEAQKLAVEVVNQQCPWRGGLAAPLLAPAGPCLLVHVAAQRVDQRRAGRLRVAAQVAVERDDAG